MQDKAKALVARRTGKAIRAGLWCVGIGFGLWLGISIGFARTKQQGHAIMVMGQSPAKHETPFACSLEKTLTKEQREHKKQITEKMEGARIETQELPDGYLFRFRQEAVSFVEVADWVATERVCCPFFDLAIEAERENGPLALRITGREGVKQFIRAEFQILKVK
jgi:hypothetical protein